MFDAFAGLPHQHRRFRPAYARRVALGSTSVEEWGQAMTRGALRGRADRSSRPSPTRGLVGRLARAAVEVEAAHGLIGPGDVLAAYRGRVDFLTPGWRRHRRPGAARRGMGGGAQRRRVGAESGWKRGLRGASVAPATAAAGHSPHLGRARRRRGHSRTTLRKRVLHNDTRVLCEDPLTFVTPAQQWAYAVEVLSKRVLETVRQSSRWASGSATVRWVRLCVGHDDACILEVEVTPSDGISNVESLLARS